MWGGASARARSRQASKGGTKTQTTGFWCKSSTGQAKQASKQKKKERKRNKKEESQKANQKAKKRKQKHAETHNEKEDSTQRNNNQQKQSNKSRRPAADPTRRKLAMVAARFRFPRSPPKTARNHTLSCPGARSNSQLFLLKLLVKTHSRFCTRKSGFRHDKEWGGYSTVSNTTKS